MGFFVKCFLIIFASISAFILFTATREKSQAQTVPVCGTSPTDVVLTIDRSGSMTDPAGSSGTKLSNAKSAARRFVNILSEDSRNRVGVVSFATQSSIDHPINANYESARNAISGLSAGGDTCTECGVFKSNRTVVDNGRANVKKVVILLTDGRANVIQGSPAVVGSTLAENKTITEVKNSHAANGTIFYTIGLGNNINADFLKKIASLTGGKYYASTTTDQLDGIYDQISQIIAKGLVSGVVFQDNNRNGAIDNLEPVLPNWNVQLLKTGSPTLSDSTDTNGAFSFPNLCDGSYSLKQTVKSGFTQTLPPDPNGYTISITGNTVSGRNFGNAQAPSPTPAPTCIRQNPTIEITPPAQSGKAGEAKNYNIKLKNNDSTECNGSNILLSGLAQEPTWDLDFSEVNPFVMPSQEINTALTVTPPSDAINGSVSITVNAQMISHPLISTNIFYNVNNPPVSPTPTSAPSTDSTFLNLVIGADGIGQTTKIPIGGNKNPLHTHRNLTVKFYNASTNQLVGIPDSINFTYEPKIQKFQADVNFPNNFESGIYNIFVEGPQYLRGQIPSSVTITKNQKNVAPILDLVTGDINKIDRSYNNIDLNDYNILLSCSIFSQDRSACELDPSYQTHSDLDDNGIVDEDDLTLWLKEIANQGGATLPE